MKHIVYLLFLYSGSLLLPGVLYGQEEESAEVSLEDYTDEFQENFFEALKQKGIENYDKAINSLLECKRLDPSSTAVDHELARVYLASGQSIQALEYGLAALQDEPANLWYLETLVLAAMQQGNALEIIKDRMPWTHTKLKDNLATVFSRKNDYKAALAVREELKQSEFSEHLAAKIKDSIIGEKDIPPPVAETLNPLETYRLELSELLENGDVGTLETRSREVLEEFPSIPYFYYIRGMALNEMQNFKEAAAILEEGLGYLLEDDVLEQNFYKALAASYLGMGNTTKASMYQNKIKTGL
jgi:tetratricopeptide (TPR) repeat protein